MGAYKQLCWRCIKTNADKCEWFKNGKLPKCCKVDKKGFICQCANFELDPIQQPNKSIAKELGISERTFYRDKDKYMKLYINMKTKGGGLI